MSKRDATSTSKGQAAKKSVPAPTPDVNSRKEIVMSREITSTIFLDPPTMRHSCARCWRKRALADSFRKAPRPTDHGPKSFWRRLWGPTPGRLSSSAFPVHHIPCPSSSWTTFLVLQLRLHLMFGMLRTDIMTSDKHLLERSSTPPSRTNLVRSIHHHHSSGTFYLPLLFFSPSFLYSSHWGQCLV